MLWGISAVWGHIFHLSITSISPGSISGAGAGPPPLSSHTPPLSFSLPPSTPRGQCCLSPSHIFTSVCAGLVSRRSQTVSLHSDSSLFTQRCAQIVDSLVFNEAVSRVFSVVVLRSVSGFDGVNNKSFHLCEACVVLLKFIRLLTGGLTCSLSYCLYIVWAAEWWLYLMNLWLSLSSSLRVVLCSDELGVSFFSVVTEQFRFDIFRLLYPWLIFFFSRPQTDCCS